ncbi:MAG: LysR family transcriptional regulator [Oligoflexales bacterium]
MEIYALKYFLAVAQLESVNKAAVVLHITPGSLSKAISKLEEELGVNLFLKQGRNIKLTESGRLLQRRASAIVQLEEDTKIDVRGSKGSLRITISASEILLKGFGMPVLSALGKIVPAATFEFFVRSDENVVQQVSSGEAHLGLTTYDIPEALDKKVIGMTEFKTCVGPGHPLYKHASKSTSVHIKDLLQHGFAVPREDILGKVNSDTSHDGWRDDKFPRKAVYKVASLSIVEELVMQGLAVAYLPNFLVEKMGARILEIEGCPYHCKQKVSVIGRSVKDIGWLKNFFSSAIS